MSSASKSYAVPAELKPPAALMTIHGLNSNGPAIIGTGIAFTVLAILAVALRFIAKRVTNPRLGMDDWLLLAALLLFVTTEILVIRCKEPETVNIICDTSTDLP